MTVRRRRRLVNAEVVAPWATLSFILLVWWAGARTLNWMVPARFPPPPFVARVDPDVPRAKPVDAVPREGVPAITSGGPVIEPDTKVFGSDLQSLRLRSLLLPVRGTDLDDLRSSFDDPRSAGRRHEAIDILAPRGTDVVAVDDGVVAKLFTSVAGGLTIYQMDPSQTFVYYYAHLDRYAPGIKEGLTLKRGDVIGAVGTTGNAPKETPHLHFAILKLDPDKRWWGGTALDPFLVWRDPSAE
jgi:peptidoglycan LD-endopeptidase LytH